MAVTLNPVLHVSTFMRPLLKSQNAQEFRDGIDVYSQAEIDSLVAGLGGGTGISGVSAFVASILGDTTAAAFRDDIDVYAKSEVYNNTETYNKTEVYTKTETTNAINTAVQAITALQGLTGAVISVNGFTGVVALTEGSIPNLVSDLAAKATVTQLNSATQTLNSAITSGDATLNFAITSLATTTQSALNLKANATSLAGYTTLTAYTALSTRVDNEATSLTNHEGRIASLEAAGPLLPESRFVTGGVTLAASDAGKAIRCGAATITIAANATVAIPTNSWGWIVRGSGAGAVNVVAGTGTNIVSPLGLTGIADQGGMLCWWKQAANTVFLSGDLG